MKRTSRIIPAIIASQMHLTGFGENEIVPVDPQVQALATPQDESFDQIARSSDFLPRIKVADSNCLEVKQGKVPVGNWMLVLGQDNVKDLGKEITAIVHDWRSLALATAGDVVTASSYNQKSPLFLQIAKRSEVKNSGCMYGPQFLVWLPDEKLLVTWFACSKTARNESSKMKGQFNKALTFKTRLIEYNGFSWFGPVIIACSTPVTILCDSEKLMEEVAKFKALPDDFQQEEAPQTSAAGRAR